jgi:dephospho-CoA kinase
VLRVGLTGGIAAGKSTVAAELARLGACVVDADRVAREVTAPGGATHEAVVRRFGRSILAPDGCIDRAALGRAVFGDSAARADLERIVHPEVRAEAERRFRRAAREAGCRVAVLDAALLVETGAWRDLDRLIVVRCSRSEQRARLIARDGLSATEAEARIDAQAPLERKLALADYVIDTSGSLAETRRQTAAVWQRLLEESRRSAGEADP